MVALLDEALVEYWAANGLRVARPFRNDLNGRIGYLDSQSRTMNADDLHRIRDLRNQLAHDSGVHTSWDQLRADTALVHSELKHLGFVGDQPVVQPFPERGAAKFEPRPPRDLASSGLCDRSEGERRSCGRAKWASKTYCLGWDDEKVQAALERGEVPPTGLKRSPQLSLPVVVPSVRVRR